MPPQWQQGQPGLHQAPQWQPQESQAYQYPQYQAPPPQFVPQAPPTAPPREPAPAGRPQAKKQGASTGARAGCAVALLAVAGLIAWFLVSVYGGSSGSFSAKATDMTVVNPATLAVTFKVTNTGSSAATPMCMVDVTDASGTYSGADEGSLSNPVQPGATVTSVMQVTVTHQGAQYVTSATVSCSG